MEYAAHELLNTRDYTGVATWRIKNLLEDEGVFEWTPEAKKEFCDKYELDYRYFARIVTEEHNFIGLDIADRICFGLGLDVSDLPIIPSGYSHSARRMAEDEFWAQDVAATEFAIKDRAQKLWDLRNTELRIPFCNVCKTLKGTLYELELARYICVACFNGLLLIT